MGFGVFVSWVGYFAVLGGRSWLVFCFTVFGWGVFCLFVFLALLCGGVLGCVCFGPSVDPDAFVCSADFFYEV